MQIPARVRRKASFAGAQRPIIGERDRLVELLGLEHFGREDSELAAIQEQKAEVRVL